MKKIIPFVLLFSISLLACSSKIKELPGNDTSLFTETQGDKLIVTKVLAPNSNVDGSLDAFSMYEKSVDEFSLTFNESKTSVHHLIFEFDSIYPIDEMILHNQNLEKISIDYSLDKVNFTSYKKNIDLKKGENIISLESTMAYAIRLVFPDDKKYTIDDVYFTLALGTITKERKDLFDAFYQRKGWTGADGIFSFNLDGTTHLDNDSNKLFIFSDTFVGELYDQSDYRNTMIMINNSIGYLDTSKPQEEMMSFEYKLSALGAPKSIFTPEAYQGKRLRNLLDSDGLYPSYHHQGLLQKSADGTQYLKTGNRAEFLIDLKHKEDISKIYLWNYNEEVNFGATNIQILTSLDNQTYEPFGTEELILSEGLDEQAFTNEFLIDLEARYLKIIIENDEEKIGLGKILIYNQNNQPLYGSITGDETDIPITYLDSTSRLWLQDGVVIKDKFYIYPILVKDKESLFKVHSVNVIEVPIVNEKLVYEEAIYHSSPLQQNTIDGGEIFFGAGVMNHIAHDGYVYLYGYKDLNGRFLTVARYKPEDILNFNQYEYFNGSNFVKNINEAKGLIKDVSAELSVTYIEEGINQGKYMLVVMENTTSGRVSYSLSDTPYGPFSPYTQIYQTTEHLQFTSAFTYNAKMQTTLSKPGRYIISYNVNANNLNELRNALIYYPRFLELIEVKRRGT